MEAKRGSKPSRLWASVLEGRELWKKGARWNIISGKDVKIWDDRWLPLNYSIFVSSPKPLGCDLEKVLELFYPNKSGWNSRLIYQFFNIEEARTIENILVAISEGRDKWVWHFTKQGKFSVKSAYDEELKLASFISLNSASSSFCPLKALWNFIWKTNVSSKLRHFLWKVCLNAIAFRENL